MFYKPFLLTWVFFILTLSCQTEVKTDANSESHQWMSSNGKLKVLTTIAMIQDIVKQVGGEFVDATALINGDLNPHSYQLVKGDDEKLIFADVILSNGLGLEHGPSLLYHLQNNPKVVFLGNKIQQGNPEEIIWVDGQVDPHIWMDVSLWMKTVPIIEEELSKRDPQHAAMYKENGRRFLDSLQDMDKKIYQLLQSIPEEKRYLVTSHDAFNYFTRAYLASPQEKINGQWQKRFASPEGLAPESQLSTTDIQHIIEYLKTYQIHVIFPESNLSKDSIRKIVLAGKEKGLDIRIADDMLYADAMGSPGSEGDTYQKMILHNAEVIAKMLDKK